MKSVYHHLSRIPCLSQLSCTVALLALLGGHTIAQDTANVIPFQGQLANQAGQALTPTNAVMLVFRIYQQPVGGAAIWAESQPNISVNAGRFSVLLGSRTQLPGTSYFNSTLYLGITVDDGNPATADVEMRPRQALVPVISASYAKNAGKLQGYGWSDLLDTNNPVTGSLLGSKIRDGSIIAGKLQPGTITSNQIAPHTITGAQIADAAIQSNHLAVGAVTGDKIVVSSISGNQLADSAVSWSKLSSRLAVTNSAALGDVAVSVSTNFSWTTYNQWFDVPGLEVSIQTRGRPVIAMLSGESNGNNSYIASSVGNGGDPNYNYVIVGLVRDGIEVGFQSSMSRI